jgi:putative intracellular protease/amidase
MRRTITTAIKAAVLLTIFVTAPVAYGYLGLLGATSAVYAPAEEPASAVGLPAPPPHDPSRPTAVVVMSHAGSEVTDVLAPYEVLARADAFNVYAVAPEARLVPLGSGLDVLPQLTFAELDERLDGRAPDLVAVPAMDRVGSSDHAAVRAWLRTHVGASTLLLAICNGSQVLADAGLLDGRSATANWAAIDEYAVRYPAVDWVRGFRYVEADDLISTAGITSGVNGTLRAVARFIGAAAASDLAREIGYPDPRIGSSPVIEQRRLEPSDAGIVILEAAYDWGRPTIGVALAEGVGEIEVASIIDVHGGDAFAARTTTLAIDAAERVRSAHGLWFVPRTTLSDAAGLDRLLVPGAAAARGRTGSFEARAAELGLRPEYIHERVHGAAPVFPFDAPLRDVAARSSVAAATLTAKVLGYPTDHLRLDGPAWPWPVLVGPMFVGIAATIAAVLAWRLLVGSLRVIRMATGALVASRRLRAEAR